MLSKFSRTIVKERDMIEDVPWTLAVFVFFVGFLSIQSSLLSLKLRKLMQSK